MIKVVNFLENVYAFCNKISAKVMADFGSVSKPLYH
jgi:hypothetical protein